MDFVPYLQGGTGLAVAPGNPAQLTVDAASLCGKAVAAQKGSIQSLDILPVFSKKCTEAGNPAIDMQFFPTQNDANLALTSGRVQGVMATSVSLAYQGKLAGGKFEVAEGPDYEPELTGTALGKKSELLPAIQAATQAVLESPTYQEINTKWGLPSEHRDHPGRRRAEVAMVTHAMTITKEPQQTAAASDAYSIVKARHPGRWISAAAIVFLGLLLLRSVVTNPNFGWETVGMYIRDVSIVRGIAITLELTAICMVIGIVLGVVLAVMRLSPNPIVRQRPGSTSGSSGHAGARPAPVLGTSSARSTPIGIAVRIPSSRRASSTSSPASRRAARPRPERGRVHGRDRAGRASSRSTRARARRPARSA